VLFLASEASADITGTTIVVDGGQTPPEGKDFRLDPPRWTDTSDQLKPMGIGVAVVDEDGVVAGDPGPAFDAGTMAS
jgi:hypothetical protein